MSAAGRTAPEHAEAAAQGWAEAVRLQRRAEPDHANFYAIACEVVATLYALQDMAKVLHGQVSDYATGREVYDDTRTVDPAERLGEAAGLLAELRDGLAPTYATANRFWSAISHIGVEVTP